jgi:hypothetical protein
MELSVAKPYQPFQIVDTPKVQHPQIPGIHSTQQAIVFRAKASMLALAT